MKVNMNQNKLKQTGFTVVEFIMIIVVIAVLSGIGFIVYQRRTSEAAATLDTAKDAKVTESELYQGDENLTKDLDEDTAKLDEVTKDVQ